MTQAESDQNDALERSTDDPGLTRNNDAQSAADGGATDRTGGAEMSATVIEADPDGLSGGTEAALALSETGEIRTGRLAGKTLTAAIAILAIPVLLEQLANAFVGYADQSIAGQLPDGIALPALDGIGIGSYVDWFIAIAMAAVGIGGQAIIARAIGAGDRDLAHGTLRQALLFGALWGALVGVALWFAAPWLAAYAQLSPAATGYCLQYIRYQSFAMPMVAVLHISMMCLHGAGETTKPFLVMLAVNGVNIATSWALSGVDLAYGGWTLANPFDFDLHVAGIALGTVIAKSVGAFLIIGVLMRGVRDLKLERPYFAIRMPLFRRIVRIGVPGFFEGLSMWVGNFAVFWVVGEIGKHEGLKDGLVGAHIIAIRWESFSFLPGFAMGVAAGALAGQYLGAGNPRMARRAILACTGIAVLFMGAAGVVLMLGGASLTAWISDDPIHLAYTPKLLFAAGAVQVFFATSLVIRNGLRGVGDTRWVFAITTTSVFLVRLPLSFILGLAFIDEPYGGLVGIWVAAAIELVVRSALFAARFLHGGWQRVRV